MWHDGRVYYVNSSTGKPQWVKPASFVPCCSAWLQRQDPRSNKPYYLNWTTKAVQWQAPTEGFEHLWQQQHDKRTGAVHWLNCVSKEKSYQEPAALSAGGPGYLPAVAR
eukprot:TRINITY_DN16418_c0_g1_i1.p2 TRINITY_DN16418_c0_g1~~TRINITY_DN16418_c0_g1_i1.p2  ORF type:complete len:109 (+),score=29.54 TRINITY_DN16418_c0_g1_i1:800-1126(+)